MKFSIYKTRALVSLITVSAIHCSFGIEIIVPDQYKDQISAIKEAEKKELRRVLDETTPESTSGESTAESYSRDAAVDIILIESVDEAKNAAAEFGDTLAADEGIISGQVVDRESGEPVSGVAILLEGTAISTLTDSEGRYSVGPAPAGEYTVSFIKSGYIEANVTEYTLVGGEVSVFPFAMPPRPAEMSDDVYELQDFTVTAEEANSLMLKLELKLDSSRALDIFSSEDFSKFAASSVADAVTRIAGVSVNDGKFPSVRGLNDRYTVTELNGMPLPSPDPFRKSPQFDIFPSSLLDSIVVSKSATADLNGESTAANFNLISKQLPDEFFLKGSIGGGWHSNSIDEFRSFDRGNDSYLLTDGASAQNEAPRDNPTDDVAREGDLISDQISSQPKRAYPNTSLSLSFGDSYEFANDRRLGFVFSGYHKRSTSAILDATESQGYDFRSADKTSLVFRPPTTISIGSFVITIPGFFETVNIAVPVGDQTTYDYEEFEESVKLGVLLGGSFQMGDDHRLFGNFFMSRTADTQVIRNFNGVNAGEQITEGDDLFLLRERLYYVERSLALGQLGGEHVFSSAALEPVFTWGLQKARTTQDEPDFRDTTVLYRFSDFTGEIPLSPSQEFNSYNIASDDNVSLSSNSWRYVEEDEDTIRGDLQLQASEQWKFFTGTLLRHAERRSEVQSYFINRSDTNPSGTTIGPTGVGELSLSSASVAIRGESDAERRISAAYLSSEYKPVDWFKANFGFRFEDSVMSVSSDTLLGSANNLASVFRAYDQARVTDPPNSTTIVRGTEADVLGVPDGFRETEGTEINQDLENKIFLPSIGLTFDPIAGVKVKLGYYETINRPSFREITADIFVDSETGDLLAGNPFLKSSKAENLDFRIEFYPEQFEVELPHLDGFFASGDMFGFSLFHKKILDPIEFIRPTDENVDEMPFNNPEGATAEGLEVEFNKNFGFIPIPWSEYFSVSGNLSFTTAVAGVSEAEIGLLGFNQNIDSNQLESERALTEQPERIVNLNLNFEHPELGSRLTLAYNSKTEILESIGSENSFDSYRGPTDRLDLILSHEFNNGLKISFAVKNLLDEGYETFFRNRAPNFSNNSIGNLEDPSSFGEDLPRKTVESEGLSYSISASYSF